MPLDFKAMVPLVTVASKCHEHGHTMNRRLLWPSQSVWVWVGLGCVCVCVRVSLFLNVSESISAPGAASGSVVSSMCRAAKSSLVYMKVPVFIHYKR